MAAKIYKVVKDGEEINNVKNLVLAKKLADEEGGEVYSGGKCIYVGGENPANEDAAFPEKSTSDQAEICAETLTPENPAPVQTQIRVETVTPEKYRLRSLMNVRKEQWSAFLKSKMTGCAWLTARISFTDPASLRKRKYKTGLA